MDNEAEQTLGWILITVGAVALYKYRQQIELFENQITTAITNFSTWVNTIILILAIAVPFWIIYKIVKKIKTRRAMQREEESRTFWAGKHIQEMFNEYYYTHNWTLERFIEILKEKLEAIKGIQGLDEEKQRIRKEIKKGENRLIERQHELAVYRINNQIEEKEKELREIERKKERVLEDLENNKKKILEKLKSSSNRVFEQNKLSKKEKDALLSNGYEFNNEFSIIEQRRIPVLIRPFGNHSFSHEFLVWDIKRLLVKTRGVRKIQEHLTKDADITFIFKNRTHALEVETGNLLSKHDQLKEKVKYLNRKYPQRWMFIVSHRDLAVKYKKFGLTSARNRVCEKLEKLLKIAHP